MRSTAARRVISTGVHVLRVVTAEAQRVPWRRSPVNPDGEVLALRMELDQAHGLIHCDLPSDKPGLLAIAAAAFGLAPDDMQPGKLEGRKATVEIEHVTTRRGFAKPIVQAWFPAQQADGQPQA